MGISKNRRKKTIKSNVCHKSKKKNYQFPTQLPLQTQYNARKHTKFYLQKRKQYILDQIERANNQQVYVVKDNEMEIEMDKKQMINYCHTNINFQNHIQKNIYTQRDFISKTPLLKLVNSKNKGILKNN